MQAIGWRKWSDLTIVKSVNDQPESIKSTKSNKEIYDPGSTNRETWESKAGQESPKRRQAKCTDFAEKDFVRCQREAVRQLAAAKIGQAAEIGQASSSRSLLLIFLQTDRVAGA